ncbi:MAG: GAF domain-containing protein [Deltaproteobacteria bacterium]|nr:GAF domain-containing protein [Deltaproteobacteria bacterium]
MQTRLNPYLIYPKDRSCSDRLWERFSRRADGDELDCRNDYEAALIEEWRRCAEGGIDAATQRIPVVAPDDFRRLLEDRKVLVERARPLLEQTRESLSGVPGIVILADGEGTILHVVGDPEMTSTAAEQSNLVEGGRFHESLAGTNGIGTAIAKRMPVHISFSEHYLEGGHIWACAGAPIFDPLTREVLGVIDFTTIDERYGETAVALSCSLARKAMAELRLQREMERLVLTGSFFEYGSRYPSDDVIVIDRAGRIVRSNSHAHPTRAASSSAALLWQAFPVSMPASDERIGTAIVARRQG